MPQAAPTPQAAPIPQAALAPQAGHHVYQLICNHLNYNSRKRAGQMNLPLSNRTHSFINRVHAQAVVVRNKTKVQEITRQLGRRTNVACIKIQECSAEGLLDLSSMFFSSLQRLSIIKCPGIREVHLHHQNYATIEELELVSNQLSQIPCFVKECFNLKSINLSQNHLKTLSFHHFQQMKSLATLQVFGNNLESLDRDMRSLVEQEAIAFEWKGRLHQNEISGNYCVKESIERFMSDYAQDELCFREQFSIQMKSIIQYDNRTYFEHIRPHLRVNECYLLISMCSQLRKYGLLDLLFHRLQQISSLQETQFLEQGDCLFERLMTLNPHHLSKHRESLQSFPFHSLVRFLNEVGLNSRLSSSMLLQGFIKSPLVKQCVFNRLVISQQDLACLLVSANKRIACLLINEGCLDALQDCAFQNEDLIASLLELDSWETLVKMMKENLFRERVLENDLWKRLVKPNTLGYKYLQRQSKKFAQEYVSGCRVLHLPEYKPSMSCFLRNDVHDYAMLKEYEQFQSSFKRKDLKLTVRYSNKENHYSIASKIRNQVGKGTLKSQRHVQRKKNGIWISKSDNKVTSKTEKSLTSGRTFCHGNFSNSKFCDGDQRQSEQSSLVECSDFSTLEP